MKDVIEAMKKVKAYCSSKTYCAGCPIKESCNYGSKPSGWDIDDTVSEIRIDDYIGSKCHVELKDGRVYEGMLTCDSRYLKITVSGEPFVFYGKDIAKIDYVRKDGQYGT